MSQISFSDAEYAGKRKKTRREVFLEEMELVVPWRGFSLQELLQIEQYEADRARGRVR
jgi:IS5 family transposase